jgi:glucokinase
MGDAPSVLGADCGGTTLRVARFEPGSLAPGSRKVVATPRVADDIPEALAEAAGALGGEIAAVGVGVAGLVDHDGGRLVWMPHVIGHDVPIGRRLAARFGVPVVVDNDATAATVAEARCGAGDGAHLVLGVFLGTGIGGGLVIDGRPERGRGHLGEIGHMVLERKGPTCPCGNRGCWEALVSGATLADAAGTLAELDPLGPVAAAAGGGRVGVEHLGAAASTGDRAASEVLEHAGEWLGRGLANLVAVLDPDVVVVGGRAAALGDRLLGPARRTLRAELEGARHRVETPVVPASLGEDAGLVGAALLAREAL